MTNFSTSKQIFSELNFYSETINEQQQTTAAGDKQSGNIVVKIPDGATIQSASLSWIGYTYNSAAAGNTIIAGNFSIKKSTDGAFTNFMALANKVNTNMQANELHHYVLTEDDVTSVVNNASTTITYNVKMASLDASLNGINLSGYWKLSLVISY